MAPVAVAPVIPTIAFSVPAPTARTAAAPKSWSAVAVSSSSAETPNWTSLAAATPPARVSSWAFSSAARAVAVTAAPTRVWVRVIESPPIVPIQVSLPARVKGPAIVPVTFGAPGAVTSAIRSADVSRVTDSWSLLATR